MRKISMFLFVILMCPLCLSACCFGATALVVGDSLTGNESRAVMNLLGHFPELSAVQVDIETVDVVDVQNADAVFFLSQVDSPFPSVEVCRALKQRKHTTVYMGDHPWLGAIGGEQTLSVLRYRDLDLPIEGLLFQKCCFPFGIPVLRGGSGERTIVVVERTRNQWLVKGFPLFGVAGWVLGDLLHDILGGDPENRKRVMIRLEDINPSYVGEDLERLRSCVDYLVDQKVPFSLAVYPVFINPTGKGTALVLGMNHGLVDLLQRAESSGGTIIMHGTSHQYYRVSGEGSEFWDTKNDAAIPEEKEYFRSHMLYGLSLFDQAGLHPKAFEAPHYNIPPSLQVELTRFFNTICGDLMLNGRTCSVTQSFPYFLYDSASGLRVMPEQLGYIRAGAEDFSVQQVMERARVLARVVRDPAACFFYHPYLAGDKVLREVVPRLRILGYEFIDLAELGGGPKLTVSVVEPLWALAGTHGEGLGRLLMIPGGFAVASLASIYLKARKKRRKGVFK